MKEGVFVVLLCCRLPLNWGTRPRYIDEYIYFVYIFFHFSMKKFKQFSKKKKKKKKKKIQLKIDGALNGLM